MVAIHGIAPAEPKGAEAQRFPDVIGVKTRAPRRQRRSMIGGTGGGRRVGLDGGGSLIGKAR